MQDTKTGKLSVSVSLEDQVQLLNSAMQSLLWNGTAWLRMSWNDTEQRWLLQRIGILDTLAQPVIFNTSKTQDE